MQLPLPAIDDQEEARVDPDLPYIVDAHVHLFPDRVFEAIWSWFDKYGWPIRHKLKTPETIEFLLSRGVGHLVALHYAHAPGMARTLNRYIADATKDEPRVTALATVLPGEPDAVAILEEAFAMGLKGVKLHCHVQCFSPDAPETNAIYEICAKYNKPLIMHAGREPNSKALKCDPYVLCAAERVEHVLKNHPRLRLCVPHLGADELDAYESLVERFDNLWLDTTMMLADYFVTDVPLRILEMRPDRIFYGTDFPNLPYGWDRELRRIKARGWNDATLEKVLATNARDFYGISSAEPENA
jgi:predicted TIM-barrel fold metal-dependent hydrolase